MMVCVAADGHALFLELQELARALAAVGNFEEKSVEARAELLSQVMGLVDVGRRATKLSF